MARRKSKKPRRRDKAISLTGVAEAIMLANVGTQAAFNLSAWDFVSDGWTTATQGRASGLGEISLWEMIYGNKATTQTVYLPGQGATTQSITPGSNADVVMANIKANWAPALVQTFVIPFSFKFGRKAFSRPIRMGNKLLKQVGLRGQVKI